MPLARRRVAVGGVPHPSTWWPRRRHLFRLRAAVRNNHKGRDGPGGAVRVALVPRLVVVRSFSLW